MSLEFELPPDSKWSYHPAVIISEPAVYNTDGCYICVMMSTMPVKDVFTFEVKNDMLEYQSDKPFSQVRCHLITYAMERHISLNKNGMPFNKLRPRALEKLMAHINEVVFGY